MDVLGHAVKLVCDSHRDQALKIQGPIKGRRAHLEALWEAYDWLHREIIKAERTYTDRQLDRMLER